MNKVLTKRFNVIGSSNGIIVAINVEDVSIFPESINIKGSVLSLKFEYEDIKSKEISLIVMDIPCERAIYLSSKKVITKSIDCVFMIIMKKGKSKSKYYKIINAHEH